MKNMETYSKEITRGNKKVKIILEFPYTADKKDAERFERNLRQVYMNQVQAASLQTDYHGVNSAPRKGEREAMSREGEYNG